MHRTRRQHMIFLLLAVLVLAPMTLTPPQANAQRVLSHYKVLRTSDNPPSLSFELRNVNDRKVLTYDPPAGTKLSEDPVLTFMVNPAGDVTLEVQINDVRIISTRFNSEPLRGFWRTIPDNALPLNGADNTIEFRKTAGTGSITIRDVVVFTHREVS